MHTSTTTFPPMTTNTTAGGIDDEGDDASLALAAIGPAICSFLAAAYVLWMHIMRRGTLYHVWNLLAVCMFGIQTLRVLFVIIVIASNSARISCTWTITFDDCMHSAYGICLMLLFSVIMFPPCYEPERSRLATYKTLLVAGVFAWSLMQVGLYLGTAEFGFAPASRNVCELRTGQVVLNAVFLWTPAYCNLFLSIIFLWWVRSRKVNLGRRRVNVFGGFLFISNVLNAIGVSIEISKIVRGKDPGAHKNANFVVFVTTLFTAFHIVTIASAFVYAEDLLPDRLRLCCSGAATDDEMNALFGPGGGGVDLYAAGNVNSQSDISAAEIVCGPNGPAGFGPQIYTTPTSAAAGGGGGSPPNANNSNNCEQQQQQHYSQFAGTTSPSSRSSSRATLTTPSGTGLTARAQNFFQNAHTLTYFLAQQRSDIVSDRNIVDSIVVRAQYERNRKHYRYGGAGGGSHHRGGGQGNTAIDAAMAAAQPGFDDDIVSRSSQVFQASVPAFGQTATTMNNGPASTTHTMAATNSAQDVASGYGSTRNSVAGEQ